MVGSLYRKAQDYLDEADTRRAELRLVRKDEPATDEDREISAEDRTKIMGQIEDVVAKIRIAITPETFRFKPRRAGWVFPVVVNLAAIVLVVGGILLAVELGRRSEQSIIAAPATLTTAEGKLLEAFKEESRQELEGKDREIADIRERLAGIDQEKERIRLEAESRSRTREQELRDEFARSLAAERERLASSGLSEVDIASRLATLETANARELETRLEAARAEVQAEREEQERTVERLRAEYEQGLAAAQDERTRLASEAERRQAELEAGSRERQLALEQEKGQALEELARLRRAQENEKLVLDQFLAYYRRARDAIQARDPGGARSVLAEFRRYLDEPAVASLSGVSARRQVELFLITSLEETATRLEGEAESRETTQTLVASANLVTAVAELVQQGDTLFAQKDYAKARDIYVMAMSRIPAVQAGHAKLGEIERLFQEQSRTEVASAFAAANAAYRAGDYERAVAAYSDALTRLQAERGTVDTLVEQLEEIGALAREAQLGPRIAELERQLAAERASVEALRGDVSARQAQLEAVRTDLAAARSDLDSGAADLAQARAELADRTAQVEGTSAELEALRSELATIRSERDRAVESMATAGTVSGTEVEGLRSELATARADLEARAAELEASRAELRDRNALLESTAAELAALREERDRAAEASVTDQAGRDSQLAETRTRLEEAQAALEARVAELTEARSQLETRTTELSARTAELAEAGATLARLTADLEAARTQAADAVAQGEALRARVDRITGRHTAVAAAREAAAALPVVESAAPDREQLLALLQTKLQVQRVLMSEQVLTQYPRLYEDNERYLEALVSERNGQTRVTVLRELDAELGALAGEVPGGEAGGLESFTAAEEHVLLLGMLDKLESLLE